MHVPSTARDRGPVVAVTARDALLHEELYVRALAVGRGAAGLSGPNPPVGCLLVRDGAIVAEGRTTATGGPHAEAVALAVAGGAARGATAVVTLEPCAHEGRTAACTEALIAAGVAEVHVLLRDPDPIAAGGLERLAAHGVRTLDVGALLPDVARSAAHDLRGFLTRVAHGRPHVTLKLAQTVDGVTTPPPGGYLTAAAARAHVHRLRAESDAVLVGSGTIAADDPRLDVRPPGVTPSRRPSVAADAAPRRPRAVVLATTADVPLGARALRPDSIVIVGPDAPSDRCEALRDTGARVITVGLDATGRTLDVGAALAALLEVRILTVLAEPGPRLAASMLSAGVVDVVELHIAGGASRDHPVLPALPGLATLFGPGMRDGDPVERTVTTDGDVILRRDVTRTTRHRPEEVA